MAAHDYLPRGASSATGPENAVYKGRWTTGVLAAALAVDAPVASIYNPAASGKQVYVFGVQLGFGWVTAATAAQQFGFYFERFSAANLGGGTVYVGSKHRIADGSAVASVTAATTAALTTAGVTFTTRKIPVLNFTDPAVGAGRADRYVFDGNITGPIVLAEGEGLSVRNLVVWPAAGTGVVSGLVTWAER